MRKTDKAHARQGDDGAPSSPGWLAWLVRMVAWALGLGLAGALALLMGVAIALAVAYPNLPEVSDLADYRPKLPLRVYTSDGV